MNTESITDVLAKYEAARRAEEASLEFGRTLDDARAFLKRAKSVRLWCMRNRDYDCFIFDVTKAAFRKETSYLKGTDLMPSEFDTECHRLTIGSWRAIIRMEKAG